MTDTPDPFQQQKADARRVTRWAFNLFPKGAQSLVAWALIFWSVAYTVKASLELANPQIGAPKLAIWQQLILLAIMLVANEYLMPKPKLENARPPGNGDYKIPTATEGRPMPLLWGRAEINAPNVIWHGDISQRPIMKRVKTGLWSSKQFIAGYQNFVAFQQGLCRGGGTNVALRGIKCAGKPVWSGYVNSNTTISVNLPELFGGNDFGDGGFTGNIEFYVGSTTQPVSSFLNSASRQRISTAASPTAPRYTGLCHVVVHEFGVNDQTANGAYIGNSTQVRHFSFDVERYPSLFPGQTGTQNKILAPDGGDDANPINVIYEYLTNTEWGMKVDTTKIGSTFLTASATCISEQLGFSMLLDSEISGDDFLKEMERHIDGIVWEDPSTGKWEITLARADYDINTVPQLNETNSRVMNYTQSTWEDTTNEVRVKYFRRDDSYKETHALAQDMANALVRGGGTVTTGKVSPAEMVFPGVKSAHVASNIAWRELRTLSRPTCRAQLGVSREFWDLKLGQAVAWTNARYSLNKKPMRVLAIDYGTLDANEIVLSLAEDTSYTLAPSFATPDPSLFITPSITLEAYPSDEQAIFETPAGIFLRDPANSFASGGAFPILAGTYYVQMHAVRQNNEIGYRTYQDVAGAPPAVGRNRIYEFMEVGTLVTALPRGQANPRSSIQVTCSLRVADAFDNEITAEALGADVSHLIMIGTEFLLPTSATYDSGTGTLTMSTVYRGVLDSVQGAHSAGAKVYFLFTGGDTMRVVGNTGGNQNVWPVGNGFGVTQDFYVRALGWDNTEFTGTPNVVTLSGTQRMIRPSAPVAVLYNGSGTPFTTPSLEGAGAGANGFRLDIAWWRRNPFTRDDVQSVLADDSTMPTQRAYDGSTVVVGANPEYRVELRADPNGANTLVATTGSTWVTGAGPSAVLRNDIITAAPAGTLLRVLIRSRYDYTNPAGFLPSGTTNDIESRYDFAHDVTPTSALTGLFYLNGTSTVGLAANVASASYTAAATGTFTVNIGAAQATANIQVSINGGAFTNVITATNTTGTFSATSGDTIRLRRTVSESPNPNFVELRNPSSTVVAYGTFKS